MDRRAKSSKGKAEPKRSPARKPPKSDGARVRDLEKRLAESLKRETVAQEQQAAAAEILRVISSSPTDVQPVFEAIVESARRLCEATYSAVFLVKDGQLVLTAIRGVNEAGIAAVHQAYPRPVARDTTSGRSILDHALVHLPDSWLDLTYTHPLRDVIGLRSILTVPFFRGGQPFGALSVWRPEPKPFTDKQIALLQTFADQAVIAIENARLFKELEVRNTDLTDALDQQTATAEILRVISTSPTNLQPVLDEVVKSAARFCGAPDASILRLDGGHLRAEAHHGPVSLPRGFLLPLVRGTVGGRSVLERQAVSVTDLQGQTDEYPEGSALARQNRQRATLSVPLLREGVPIGVILLRRAEAVPFTDKQIALSKIFADQAVIAIENVRLFSELQEKNRALTEALEQQTATSEILQAIAQAQTDAQPVFETIVRSAAQLCHANGAAVFLTDGHVLYHPANYGSSPEAMAAIRANFPRPLDKETVSGAAILTRSVVQVPDVEEPSVMEFVRQVGRRGGFRSLLSVPMLRRDEAVGTINVTRPDPGSFSDAQVALLQTFADQAVIAIENVRLFTELQQKNEALTQAHAQVTEALDQQTATSEILGVISASPTDVQPVFDAIAASATRLCDALNALVIRFDGQILYLVAHHNVAPERLDAVQRGFPRPADRGSVSGRVVVTRAVVHVEDVNADPEYTLPVQTTVGYRTALGVPMLREGAAIGLILVARDHVAPFSDQQIALLQTFADQAVIAIENVRLFKELQARTGELTQSVEQLTALGEVSRSVTSTLDVETVLETVVSRARQLAGADGCLIYEYDEGTQQFHIRATNNLDTVYAEALRGVPIRKGEGVSGRAAEMREPVEVADITQPSAYQSSVRDITTRAGYRAVLSVPLLREDEIIGSLILIRKTPGEFSPEIVELLKTFATQSALAIQNARLFREIEDKGRQLEAASQHKSEFLANMSHELRTPLNAIIGFSEVLVDRMFGELNERQDEYLKDIYASGQHLLSLINDILDLSKIEAGRMELEATDFDLPSAIDNALTLVRERATRRGITLGRTIDDRLGMLHGDERKVKQVLLNLLSNALKFTPEGGRIDVRAAMSDGMAEIAVADTGVGIAPQDQEAIFEEFRQVGTADKKVEGTGLGLALSQKFIELHGGRIWVQSKVGKGSTFTFTLPMS